MRLLHQAASDLFRSFFKKTGGCFGHFVLRKLVCDANYNAMIMRRSFWLVKPEFKDFVTRVFSREQLDRMERQMQACERSVVRSILHFGSTSEPQLADSILVRQYGRGGESALPDSAS
jgi:hypothetical protein